MVHSPKRIQSLDGLRGLAAFLVMNFHLFAMNPTFSNAYDQIERPTPGTAEWWFTYTPLHFIWAGPELVFLFFVLSGLVLARSSQSTNFEWKTYFGKRLARLYLPVWVAVAFAWISIRLVSRAEDGFGSTWLARRNDHYSAESLRTDLFLIFGDGKFTLSPLWSLKWEVFFSILLPVAVTLFYRNRRPMLLASSLLVVTFAGSVSGWGELRYLPMFGLGVILAANWEGLQAWLQLRLNNPVAAGVFLVASISLFTARWWPLALGFPDSKQDWLDAFSLLGSLALVVVTPAFKVLNRVFSSKRMVFLGTISFSLYLTHESVIVTLKTLMPTLNSWLFAPSAWVAAVAVGAAFYRWVEKPILKLITPGR